MNNAARNDPQNFLTGGGTSIAGNLGRIDALAFLRGVLVEQRHDQRAAFLRKRGIAGPKSGASCKAVVGRVGHLAVQALLPP